MHYLDEGPSEVSPILMMHGEPSWSYLYRHMIPICAAAGHRVIAPDLIGFGKSDKPTDMAAYSYQTHMDWLLSLLDQLELENITLVCQDWGSLLGLRLAAENPERFRAIVVGNGMLPTGDQKVPAAFQLWKKFAIYSPLFPIARLIDLPIQQVLIDPNLLRDAAHAQTLVAALLGMATDLQLTVTAQAIQTPDQAERARRAGIQRIHSSTRNATDAAGIRSARSSLDVSPDDGLVIDGLLDQPASLAG